MSKSRSTKKPDSCARIRAQSTYIETGVGILASAFSRAASVRWRVAAALAAIAATTLSLGSPVQAAPKGTAAPSQAPTVAFMSPEEYARFHVSKFGKPAPSELHISTESEVLRTESGRSFVTDDGPAPGLASLEQAVSAPLFDPVGSTPWHSTLWADTDKRGTYVPTRFGNSDLGYSHYSVRHNLRTSSPFRVIRNTSKPIVDQGAHLEYQALLTNMSNGSIKIKIRIVVQAANRTDNGKWRTPDGKNIGTITAYCEGVTKCPDWVNQV